MSFCIHCGKQIQENMRFCKYCGSEVKAAPQPVAAYIGSGEEETIFMDAAPAQQVAYQKLPKEEDYPVVAVFDEPKKKKHIARWVVLFLVLLLLAGATFYMLYNDNYKTVLSTIGLWREQEPETAAPWTEPTPEQAQAPYNTDPPLEFNFPAEETLPSQTFALPVETSPGDSGPVSIPPTMYIVVFEEEHNLRMRKGPSTDYEIIGSIPKGGVVTATQIWNDWAYVTYDGTTGWSSMEYLQLIG